MISILQVCRNIDPKDGGPTRSCKGICRALASMGAAVTLLVLRGRHEFENPCGVKVVYKEDGVPKDLARRFQIVHIQGLWTPEAHAIVRTCRRFHIPYVISPRGMLEPWALSVKRWKKILGMMLYQRADLRGAAFLHATAEAEANHIREAGFTSPIVVSPNGVDLPEELGSVVKPDANKPTERIAIFMSRLHPGKGLLNLARAWARAKPIGWRMRIVGPDSYGHKKDVVALLKELGIDRQWEFVDMMSDSEKWSAYAEASLLIHPSVSENFGITIAEGLAAGLPVIATKGAPWQDLEDNQCGWWVDQGVEPLVRALQDATNSDKLAEMGRRGHELVVRKYAWSSCGSVLLAAYRKLVG